MIRALAFLTILTGCSPMIYTHGVPNLVEVEPDLLRGGQPTAEGWAYLKARGVRTVVKLNYDREGVDLVDPSLHVYAMAIPPADIDDEFRGPSKEDLHKILSLLVDPALRPLYVHCTHGQDRTGIAVGVYRLAKGWRRRDAWREMRALNFHPGLFGLFDSWEDWP